MNNRTEEKLKDTSGMEKAIKDLLRQAWDRGYKYGLQKGYESGLRDKEADNLCDDCKIADDCTASLKGLTGCKTTKCYRHEWADKEAEE